MTCRNLSVKICTDESNKVKTSDKQMHVHFCDNSFVCQMYSDKFERWSNKFTRVKSIVHHPGRKLENRVYLLYVIYRHKTRISS